MTHHYTRLCNGVTRNIYIYTYITNTLRTGMKCLPSSRLARAKGNVLHDWHAEVVAIRALNRHLVDECLRISTPPYPQSDVLQPAPHGSPQRFTIRDNVSLHMYCSEAPCGDASMELTMALQADATPWTSAPPTLQASSPAHESTCSSSESQDSNPSALRGRSNFSHLGVVRAKPSRPDAPPTLSKSCSDKLALKQSLSLLSSTTSLLISPRNAYLDTLILPASQYIPSACSRAFSASGRLKNVLDLHLEQNWSHGYKFHPFTVLPTTHEFAWSRRAVRAPTEKAIPSNLSAVSTPHWQETLIGGVLQGRKQFDVRGASRISRRAMWIQSVRLAGLLAVSGACSSAEKKQMYADMKQSDELAARRRVKQDVTGVLGGWIRNSGDEEWVL